MKKAELIKCFEEDKAQRELKDEVEKIVKELNRAGVTKAYAGVEESSFYVIDSEYHIFYGKKHITIKKEEQDPWLPDYYIIRGGSHKKSYCYNFKQMEIDIKERLLK
jgi:hypothetical protein